MNIQSIPSVSYSEGLNKLTPANTEKVQAKESDIIKPEIKTIDNKKIIDINSYTAIDPKPASMTDVKNTGEKIKSNLENGENKGFIKSVGDFANKTFAIVSTKIDHWSGKHDEQLQNVSNETSKINTSIGKDYGNTVEALKNGNLSSHLETINDGIEFFSEEIDNAGSKLSGELKTEYLGKLTTQKTDLCIQVSDNISQKTSDILQANCLNLDTNVIGEQINNLKSTIQTIEKSFDGNMPESIKNNLDNLKNQIDVLTMINTLPSEIKDSIGTDITKIGSQTKIIDNTISFINAKIDSFPAPIQEKLKSFVADLETQKSTLNQISEAVSNNDISKLNILSAKYPDLKTEIAHLSKDISTQQKTSETFNKISSDTGNIIQSVNSGIGKSILNLNVSAFELGNNHLKASLEINTKIETVNNQISIIDNSISTIDKQLQTTTDKGVKDNLTSMRTELLGQKNTLSSMSEILGIEKNIHEVMMTNNKGVVDNNEIQTASPEKVQKLKDLSSELSNKLGSLPENAKESIGSFIEQAKVVQKFSSDIAELAGNSNLISSMKQSEKGVSMARIGQQYMEFVEDVQQGNRKGKGETADVSGFLNKNVNDISYDTAFAGKMKEFAGKISSGQITNPDEIKTIVENMFRGNSGNFFIPESKVNETVKVFQEYGEAVLNFEQSKENVKNSNIDVDGKTVEELEKCKFAIDQKMTEIQGQIQNAQSNDLPDISKIGFGKLTEKQLQETGDKTNNLNAQTVQNNTSALNNLRTESAEVSSEISEVKQKQIESIKIDQNVENFSSILSPINSPGDKVNFTVEGKIGAGVNFFGATAGVELDAKIELEVNQDNDGWYYLVVDIEAGANAVVKVGTDTAGAKGYAGVGGKVTEQFRFKSLNDLNEYLKDELGKTGILTKLDPVKPYELPHTVTKVGGFVKAGIEGKIKVFGMEVEAGAEYKNLHQEVTYASKSGVNSKKGTFDEESMAVNIQIGKVGVVGEWKHTKIDGDIIDANNGDNKTFDGMITFELTSNDIKTIKYGDIKSFEDKVFSALNKIDGLGQAAIDAMARDILNKAMESSDKIDNVGDIGIKTIIGVAYQSEETNVAQAGQPDDFKNTYTRIGGVTAVEISGSFNAGVVWGEFKAKLSSTDYRDLDIRKYEVPNYLEGLFVNNKAEYDELLAKQGIKEEDKQNIKMFGTESSLADYESAWSQK